MATASTNILFYDSSNSVEVMAFAAVFKRNNTRWQRRPWTCWTPRRCRR